MVLCQSGFILVMLSFVGKLIKKNITFYLHSAERGYSWVVAMISILGLGHDLNQTLQLLDIIIGTAIVLMRYTAIYSGKITRGRGFHTRVVFNSKVVSEIQYCSNLAAISAHQGLKTFID